MQDIWQLCDAGSHTTTLETLALRIVESQEKVATMKLVDSVDEQVLLESILDDSKPAPISKTGKHYLITTPFRYPPLRHGSRFGQRNRRGLFYGSLEIRTTLAECAYYRLVFWHGMSTPPPMGRLISEHTTFAVSIYTHQALRLEQQPFSQFMHIISSPDSYQATQTLGERMREHHIDAFSYPSARDCQQGINIGVFSPGAIRSNKPLRKQQWTCITTAQQVSFMRVHASSTFSFPLQQYLIEDHLPLPAI